MTMKIIKLVVFALILASFAMFANVNQAEVSVWAPWPFKYEYFSTVAWTALGGFLVGISLAIFFLGTSYMTNWNTLRKKQKENTKLSVELSQLKQSSLSSMESSIESSAQLTS